MKDREQIMEDYWASVTKEELIADLVNAGFKIKDTGNTPDSE